MPENWFDAFSRILGQVQREHPDWDEADQFAEYKSRCDLWKFEHGFPVGSGRA